MPVEEIDAPAPDGPVGGENPRTAGELETVHLPPGRGGRAGGGRGEDEDEDGGRVHDPESKGSAGGSAGGGAARARRV